MWLEEVGRGGDIFRDDLVALPGLGNAVDLYGEQHGDSRPIKLTSEHDRGRRSPTMAVENDAGLGFFFGAEDAVMVGVEQAQNGLVGSFSVAVLKNLDGCGFGQA